MSINILDIIILIPIAYGLIRGLVKGLVHELTALVAIVAGVVGARLWAPMLAVELGNMLTMKPTVAQALSYFLMFIAIALSLHLVGRLFTKLLSAISMSGLNRALGALFGMLKMALVVSVLINGFEFVDDRFDLLEPEIKEASVCYRPVERLAMVAWEQVSEL